MTSRRELLLESAADLFAAKGYHAVGIDDIGAAAGITGPGVYRHFPSKQALLETLIDRTMDRMLDLAEHAEDLDALVELHVTLVTEQKQLVSVWTREQAALADDVARSLRVRMRRYEQVWRDAAAPLRPDLSAPELSLVVGATLAMLNASTLMEVALNERRHVLCRLAHAALRA
ncbi:MAG: TetR/AcrR family transcriptional regulator [Mycobacteriales bacterium]